MPRLVGFCMVLGMRVMMMILLVGFGSVGACAAIETTRTGPTVPARSADCEVQVFTIPPASGYQELAVIDVGSSYRSDVRSIEGFRDLIRPDVCAVGGEAIYVHSSGGKYSRATVLRAITP